MACVSPFLLCIPAGFAQLSAMCAHLDNARLLRDDLCFVEFGAGKGSLSEAVFFALGLHRRAAARMKVSVTAETPTARRLSSPLEKAARAQDTRSGGEVSVVEGEVHAPSRSRKDDHPEGGATHPGPEGRFPVPRFVLIDRMTRSRQRVCFIDRASCSCAHFLKAEVHHRCDGGRFTRVTVDLAHLFLPAVPPLWAALTPPLALSGESNPLQPPGQCRGCVAMGFVPCSSGVHSVYA